MHDRGVTRNLHHVTKTCTLLYTCPTVESTEWSIQSTDTAEINPL